VWDWIFRTSHLPRRMPVAYGMHESMPDGWLGQLAAPFRSRREPRRAVAVSGGAQ
jgi:hypothetical protein